MRTATAASAAALVLLGCTREPPSAPPPAPPPPEATRAAAEGEPQITTSPDGVHIQYRLYGSGEPAVVLVHGWSADSSYWRGQLDDLKTRYTVVTVDLAGHGGSGRNRADWSMGSFGEDVAAAVRDIPATRLVLVGHAMGGPVALEAASRMAERVIGIIGVEAFRSIGQPPLPRTAVDRQIEELRRDFIGNTRKLVSESFFTKSADPLFVRKVADDMALAPPEVATGSIIGLNAMDFGAVLPKISVPIVAINSDLPPPTDEERIRRMAPTFRAFTLANTGHFLMMEEPQRFNPVLLREIAALAGDADE
ncbi:MAG TPA: alpha/beta hydrolase [Steroidobacteraceae bacterium]|nr:alpha/beta hydrolase [Steroidobacteraceae bacterium]